MIINNRVLLLSFVLTLVPWGWADEGEFFGMILQKEGEAYMTRGILEFPARIEDSLRYGDEIETLEDGRVQISFRSSFISIGPNSYFTLSKEDDESLDITIIELDEGSIRSRIIGLESNERYEVRSEQGKVVVTGTDFVTSVGDGFNVSVLRGSVDMVPSDGGPTQPVGTMESFGGLEESGMSSGQLSPSDLAQIKAELPLPTDQTEAMAEVPVDASLDITIDAVPVETITQSIESAVSIAEPSIVSGGTIPLIPVGGTFTGTGGTGTDGSGTGGTGTDGSGTGGTGSDGSGTGGTGGGVISPPDIDTPGGGIDLPGIDPPTDPIDGIDIPGILPPGETGTITIGVPGMAPPTNPN